jgi:hypothetical protein
VNQNRIFVGFVVAAAALSTALLASSLADRPVNAQSDTPRQQVAALSTRVAVLESTVADLSTRVAVLETPPAGPSQTAAMQPSNDASGSEASPAGTAQSDRTHPIPIGQSATVGEWTMQVTGVTPNATKAILAQNQFNDPPPDGKQFYLISISLTYNGSDTGNAYDITWKAVDANNVSYTTYDPSCGVISQEFNLGADVFPGGTIRGNICFVVDSAAAKTLVLYAQPSFSFSSDNRVWFSVQRR